MNDATPTNSIDIDRIEIVIDDDHPDQVEIYMLDEQGRRVEGGTFSRDAFMRSVQQFYDQNY